MSKYHAHCCPDINDYKKEKSKKGPPLTSKPFCDCETCTCKDCPDILKLLCITVTENSCDFGTKEAGGTNDNISDQILEYHTSIMHMMPEDLCACEVMARTVRSDVHVNIAMAEEKAETNKKNSNTTNDTRPTK